ncbi:acyltransferase [Winogradskyella sp.]|uniref:acyltransferase family protein n=1 Tax=Winogradskyella sp. TaxID=1883156 RepID=UPI0026108D06|nr:acyltransferase [Winogradskyella sp.]
MSRLPNLDPLRFFLASIVILFHVPKLCRNQSLPYYDGLPIFHRGMEAVFMFFILSGFLIIRIIYLEKKRSTFSIKRFYTRRMLRIFPLYYFVVIFGFLFYFVLLPALNIPFENNYHLIDGILLSVFFLPNVFAELYRPGGILEILWSIGIEEQFYLVIAPLLFFIKRKQILVTLLLLSIIYFLIFHSMIFDYLKEFHFYFYFLFSGGVVALLEEHKKLEVLKSIKLAPLVITTLTFLYFFTDMLITNILWLDHLIILSIFPVFIHTISFNNRKLTITNKTFNYLGTISYGIYMFHVIALNFVVFLFLKLDFLKNLQSELAILIIFSLTFAVTIAMAHLSYKYFESYFLRLKHKFRS